MTNASGEQERMLEGIRVLDLSRVMSGPFCTAMLADLGAEVIKLEMPGVGEDARRFGPFREGESAYFLLLNRGKKSVTLNLKSEQGRSIVHRLAASSDVLVENFRPGVADRLGIGFDALQGVNPRLIYASISGFGQEGPLSGRPAYDLVVQAMSGLMDITGQRDGSPTVVGESVADVCSGIFAAWGITTALFRRERTGRGCHIDIAMLDSVFSMLLTVLSIALYSKHQPTRIGNRHPVTYPVDSYRAKDGHVVIVVASDPAFDTLAKIVGRPELREDLRFRTNADRSRHERELREIIEIWTSERGTSEIVDSMNDAGIPSAPVLSITDVLESAHIAFRGMMSTVDHSRLGDIPVVHQPVRFSNAGYRATGAPPTLGEHTQEILSSVLGFNGTEIERLRARGII